MQSNKEFDLERQSKRRSLYDLAWFVDPAVDALVECSVHNISEGGALISTPNAEELSDFIYLRLRGRPDITECRVKWRSENSAGIEFVGALGPNA
ncbi:MAG: PilZ domain-containing protein [Hyphomicrobiales bacterium]